MSEWCVNGRIQQMTGMQLLGLQLGAVEAVQRRLLGITTGGSMLEQKDTEFSTREMSGADLSANWCLPTPSSSPLFPSTLMLCSLRPSGSREK